MVALSRCLGSLVLLFAGAEGGRISRKRGSEKTKFIADVPVLNYHAAYGGARSRKGVDSASFGELEDAEQEWIVMLRPGTTNAQAQSLCKLNKNGCNFVGAKIPFLELRGTEADLEQVINGAGAGGVEFIEPDQPVFVIPDYEVGTQATTWGLNRIGADNSGRSGAGVTIYVQDTGVRVTHQEFGGRAASALDVTAGPPYLCNGDLNCAQDVQGHGTHCAGTAAGANYGVATGAAVRAIKTLSDQGSGSTAWQLGGIDWVTASGARPAVMSMSLGGSGVTASFSTSINAAVEDGVTVVVAGGNSNSNACNFSPAFVATAITVGSTDSNDVRSSFSNYGSCTNIWAPGSSVTSAGVSSDSAYATYSGTSMACPHVSGGAALILSVDPTMKASAVLDELLANAVRDAISDLQAGDTNALLYVGAGGAPPTPPTQAPAPTPPSNCPSWCSEAWCFFSACRTECSFC